MLDDWFRSGVKRAAKAGKSMLKGYPTGPKGPGWTAGVAPTQLPEERQGLNAKVVMHHFARSKVRGIDQQRPFEDEVWDLLAERFPTYSDAQILRAIQRITYQLQRSDLTINFMAQTWFAQPNTYTTYTQMYERAVRDVPQADGSTQREMRLVPTPGNNAPMRDQADTNATFGTGSARPDAARFLDTGGIHKPAGVTHEEYVANNPLFNPKAKPIFAGLNYGRRPHGSTTTFGFSHLILRDEFKINALYYMGDTFYVHAHARPVTYNRLAAVLLVPFKMHLMSAAEPDVAGDMLKATLMNTQLSDSFNKYALCEAHLYDQIILRQDIKEMRVSKAEVDGLHKRADGGALSPPDEVRANAEEFAKRNTIKLTWVD